MGCYNNTIFTLCIVIGSRDYKKGRDELEVIKKLIKRIGKEGEKIYKNYLKKMEN